MKFDPESEPDDLEPGGTFDPSAPAGPDARGRREMSIGLDAAGRRVVVDFGTDVHYIAMTPAEAEDFARSLVHCARKARREGPT